eukprot:CAMPEP_0194290788 /NCGR_PEP_ID=MMETSP0169-20130528/42040_1 /TAXON_ID=218684 /ORGANISM="Corethron pennatum, Strain L29A3" /LENGTH=76 /DNA_ID=CAMNT_0039038487 /DNA_START=108 /DNA_END=335 /DNA_ORIENTATION=-
MMMAKENDDSELWTKLSALTLATKDMKESVSFYQKMGLVVSYGSDEFTTLHPPPKDTKPLLASLYINLTLSPDYDE